MIYFIADTHFGHENIIRFSKRPFNSIEEMDAELIRLWNEIVTDEDLVYIVGDFWYRGSTDPATYVRKLKGKKVLIKGNHDVQALKNKQFVAEFDEIVDMKEIVLDGTHIVMCHYPIIEWNGYFRGSYHIHGHVHINKPEYYDKLGDRILNAGADITGLKPVTFEQLIEANKKYYGR